METQKPSAFRLVTSFFTIPLLIVLICVGIFYLFGRITYEQKGIEDYLNEIKTDSANRRWQAAYELSKRLGAEKVSATQGEKLAGELARLYEKEAREEDPRLRRYVVLGLAGLERPSSFPHFKTALADRDADVQLYAIWGLGILKNTAATPTLTPYLQHEDAALRKMAAYALGMIGDKKASPALKSALEDSVPDVQWNSALALAQLGDTAAIPKLHRMLDRAYLDHIPNIKEAQKIEVMAQAIKGVVLLNDRTARPLLEKLLQTESNPQLIEAARNALKELH